jgi:hypothetical protein
MGLGVGIVGLFELLNPTVLRPLDITRAMGGVTPYATLPMMRTRRQILLRRAVIAAIILLVVVAAAAGLWVIEQYVMPLDVLVDRIAERTGLASMWSRLVGTVR